jgi:membrane fusion protein, multidrug efflux system
VTFAVPATRLPAIRSHDAKNPLSVSALPQDEDHDPETGAVAFVDNSVDTTTDTIKLKAQFANTNHRLWPGQFARVSLRLGMLSNAMVVSNEAVQTGQDGPFVFVVKPDSTVEQRAVTITQRENDDVVIGQGLKAGETIVTEGQLRLEPGSKVQQSGQNDGRSGAGGRRGGTGAS